MTPEARSEKVFFNVGTGIRSHQIDLPKVEMIVAVESTVD